MVKSTQKSLISVIIPCYNEQAVIHQCHERVIKALKDLSDYDYEVIYIDDGSSDNTYKELQKFREQDKAVKILKLSRNFGKEAALTAGIDHCKGDAAVILDADLQDPPELIPDLIKVWKDEDADVVYGQRTSREGESWFKKFTASAFYKVINFISGKVDIPYNAGDFRLMNRRSIDALIQLREQHRFMKGLFSWIGYKQVAMPYQRHARPAGRTKWDYISLWNLSLEGITGFSMTPLKIATVFGLLISFMAFVYGSYIVLKTLMFGTDVPGYPSLMVAITFFSGIQLLSIGILGEYVGRIFNETKHRPVYFLEAKLDD